MSNIMEMTKSHPRIFHWSFGYIKKGFLAFSELGFCNPSIIMLFYPDFALFTEFSILILSSSNVSCFVNFFFLTFSVLYSDVNERLVPEDDSSTSSHSLGSFTIRFEFKPLELPLPDLPLYNIF
jgi:hypothetical protein